MFCPSHTEVAILETILSANGAMQRAGENYFCSTNHMCDTVQVRKGNVKMSRNLQFIGQLHNTLAQS